MAKNFIPVVPSYMHMDRFMLMRKEEEYCLFVDSTKLGIIFDTCNIIIRLVIFFIFLLGISPSEGTIIVFIS